MSNNGTGNRLSGALERATFLGEFWRYRVALAPPESGAILDFLTLGPLAQHTGDQVDLFVAPEHVALLPLDPGDPPEGEQ
jgi:hypothetical protein